MQGIHYVLAVTLITWVGLFLYMLRVDLKVREAQRREEI